MTVTDLPASKPKLQWMTAIVREVIDETPRVRSLVLDIPDWPGHRAGQHVDVRLTSDAGYQAQRSYSIASAPEGSHVMLTVERLADGEVSSYLAGDVVAGDQFELRGPIGGYFVWTSALGGPVFLVGGGSGLVPLMSMLRHRAAAKSNVPATLLYSSRTAEDIIYRAELDQFAGQGDGLTLVHTLTRQQPVEWRGLKRRIDRDMLQSVGFAPELKPRIFICGPTPLVEQVARDMRDLGHAAQLIKTERFGPTGR
ncbi:MAG TPA: ferredoxin reductase [Pseudolabrys sp.]|jgi:ferredoxin-NADP reductase